MDIKKQIEWLKPDRILKLYDGEKNMQGMNRLMIIGVGKNGIDCLLRTKHTAENRFNHKNSKIRFLAIGYKDDLSEESCCGTTLTDSEMLCIDPEESIYKYLNNPELLSPQAAEWFDTDLKNYSDDVPKYGLLKRQCGRVALFHYIEKLLKLIGKAIDDFSASDAPIEITVVGNMGDTLFGGTVVDLGYILTSLFKTLNCSVKINSLMFVGDTAQLFEKDARNLANYYANTIVTKGELDLFQNRKSKFSQKYTESFEITSDKPPFHACYIASAEENYEATLFVAAEKLLSAGEFIYKTDDDAEKMISYNMLEQSGSHSFRYLSYDVAGVEIPMGKIVSYLSIKLFGSFCNYLKQNSVGDMQIGIYIGKVTPDAMLLASRAGVIPKIEFDENYNALFTMKSLKRGSEASRNYVDERVNEFARLVKEGADKVLPEIVSDIISSCEDALSHTEKGPFCATEIVNKCLSAVKTAIKKVKEEKEDVDEQIIREEKLVQSDYRKLKSTPAIMAGNAARLYISSLSEYAVYAKQQKTVDIMLEFYTQVCNKLSDYSENVLAKKIEIFSIDESAFLSAVDFEQKSCIKEAFDVNSPEILAKLDKLVEDIPESTKMLAFKKMKILDAEDNSTLFAEEIVNLAAQCFGGFLLMGYNDFCEFFNVKSSVKDALQDCFDRVNVKTPTLDETPLTRILCPKNIKQGDIAPIKASRQGINYIWNVSPLFNAAVVVQIKGGVKIDGFKDYNQWENMRYAYVNDSLKKQGIHIFKNN